MTCRLTWDDFPSVLRRRLEVLLGGPVERTRSCTGGFSPSSAEIISARSGHELFVKAVRGRDNPGSLRLNRDEAAVLAALPATSPVPSLVDSFTEGEWFALVTEVAPGTLPEQPWTSVQLDRVLDALDGNTLCHSDVRADNRLLAEDGVVSIVDWAWASRGSRIADALQLLSSVEDPGESLGVNARVDAVLDGHDLPHRVGTDVLAGVLGFFVDAARRPSDPSLPFLHCHRRARRNSLLPLLRARWT